MASLFNTRISDTYQGLIKTIDNAAITATLKELTDGSGNSTGVYINNAGDFKVTAILEFGSLKDTAENIIISKFVDAADGVLNNDNDTSIPTTAAIIDYVQGHVTLQDLDFQGDTGTGAVDLDSQLLDIAGTANQITTVASNQTLTISLNSSGVVLPDGSTATTQSQGDNSTKVATTAYVDILDAASDLDFSGDTGTGDVNLNTQTFAVTGTTNQIVTTASGQGLSLSLPATVHRNLQGNVTGNVTGDLTGNVTATSVLADGVTATTQASTDDSTKVATTAYVKSLNNASDLDFTTDSGSGAVVLNTETLSVIGTANEIETSGSGQQIQIGLPSSINVNVTGNLTGSVTGNVTGNVVGNVTGDLTGNADTATAWETARDLSLTGQATGTISGVDGTGNVSGSVTLDNNSVTGKVLTGLTSPSASSVLATDTIVEGFGKLQSQINGLAGGLRFIGSWDADTNSPVLTSGGGEAANGTTTSTSANKLVDSSASFTSTVTVGDKVINQVDGQSALVTNVDSDTTLSLDADIMLSGEAYTIDNSPFITQGHYYVVSVGGTTTLNGVSNWSVGDWVIAGANNQWTKLDHSQVDGTGTPGNLTKWSATQVIADSIVSESGSAITVDGSLSTNTNLSSTGDFAVNTDKFTVAAASGNTAFAGDLAINTNKFTVNSTTGNTLVAGTLDVTGKTTFGDDIIISDGTPILDFEDTNNTDSNWRMEARGSFGGFFFQSFDNNFQTGSTVLFAKSSNGYIGLGGNTNPQAELDITGGLITSGNITVGDGHFIGDDSFDNLLLQSSSGENLNLSSANDVIIYTGGTAPNSLGTQRLRIFNSDGSATFSGEVTLSAETQYLNFKKTSTADVLVSMVSETDAGSGGKLRILTKRNGDTAVNALTIDDNQNVGIGTDSPSSKLEVISGASHGTGFTQTRSGHPSFSLLNGGTNSVYLGIAPDGGSYNTFMQVVEDGTDINYIRFNTGASTERMRIDSSGTTSFKNDVIIQSQSGFSSKGFWVQHSNGNYAASLIHNGSGDEGRLSLYDTNVETVRISGENGLDSFINSGNVGIGETSPLVPLHISRDSASGENIALILDNNDTTVGAEIGMLFRCNTNSTNSDYEIFAKSYGSNDTALVFQSDGSVETFRLNKNGSQEWNMSNATVSVSGSTGGNVTLANTTGTWAFRAEGSSVNSMTISSSKITLNEVVDVSNDLTIDNASPELYFKTGGTHYRWMVAAQENIDGALEITPSTTAGGSTYNSPLAVFKQDGEMQIRHTLPTIQLYNTDDGLALNQTLGDIEWYQIDPSDQGTGVVARIRAINTSTFSGSADLSFQTGNATSITERLIIKSTGEARFGWNSGAYTNPQTIAQFGNTVVADEYGASISSSGNGLAGYFGSNAHWANNAFSKPTSGRSAGYMQISNNATANTGSAFNFNTVLQGGTTHYTRMSITSGGDVLVGQTGGATSAATLLTDGYAGFGVNGTDKYIVASRFNDPAAFFKRENSNGVVVRLKRDATDVGSISVTTSSTSYNTSSDYRLKEDLQDFAGLDMVSKIPVYDFKWKSDESRSYGVMAHELQEVLPQAVSGDKDAEEMQSVDYSKIVPLLVKSIQELKAEVDKLKQECNCKN